MFQNIYHKIISKTYIGAALSIAFKGLQTLLYSKNFLAAE